MSSVSTAVTEWDIFRCVALRILYRQQLESFVIHHLRPLRGTLRAVSLWTPHNATGKGR